jgi:hypothetical protein
MNEVFTLSCLVTAPTVAIPLIPCWSPLLMVAPFQLPILESESYITTDCESASLSWNKEPIWGLRPDFYYCQLRVCWCGALSLTRGRVSFTIAAGPWQRSHFRFRVSWDSWPYFTVSDSRLIFRRLLQLAGLRRRYSTPPPRGIVYSCSICPPYNPSAQTTVENTVFNSSSIVACKSVATIT